jgi:VCBS repeat-containing protein
MRLFFLTAIVLALVGAAGAALAARGSTAVTTIKVTEREYHIALSATSAKAGTFTFSVHNAGKIVHKLDLAGAGLKSTVRVPSIAPGATRSVTVKLTGGKLSIWCPVPGHAALGMQTSFKVSGATSGSGWG